MRIIRHIAYLMTLLAVMSCMAEDGGLMDNAPLRNPGNHYVIGKVLNADDEGIEHIKVTIDWGGHSAEPAINYTASDGSFSAEIPAEVWKDTFEFKITLEDIDGKENGGTFEAVTDNVIYNSSPESPSGFLVYRLNRAIASESSPRS